MFYVLSNNSSKCVSHHMGIGAGSPPSTIQYSSLIAKGEVSFSEKRAQFEVLRICFNEREEK